jgi:hypothetical protein
MNSLWSDTRRTLSKQDEPAASCDDNAVSVDRGDSFVSLTGMEAVGRQDSMISVVKIDAVLTTAGDGDAGDAIRRDCSLRESPGVDTELDNQCAAV